LPGTGSGGCGAFSILYCCCYILNIVNATLLMKSRKLYNHLK
jgi:hypothetical protein